MVVLPRILFYAALLFVVLCGVLGLRLFRRSFRTKVRFDIYVGLALLISFAASFILLSICYVRYGYI